MFHQWNKISLKAIAPANYDYRQQSNIQYILPFIDLSIVLLLFALTGKKSWRFQLL